MQAIASQPRRGELCPRAEAVRIGRRVGPRDRTAKRKAAFDNGAGQRIARTRVDGLEVGPKGWTRLASDDERARLPQARARPRQQDYVRRDSRSATRRLCEVVGLVVLDYR